MFGVGAFGALALALVIMAGSALAQMPPDTKFINNIRDRNHSEAMPYLVNGGTPNARDFDGTPALLAAAEVNDPAMVRSLLEYGANPDIASRKTGETALMRAASTGSEDILALLVHYKADLDESDNNGETALIKAVRAGQLQMVGLLLMAGADFELADYTGQTPYDYARRGRNRRIESLLREVGAGS